MFLFQELDGQDTELFDENDVEMRVKKENGAQGDDLDLEAIEVYAVILTVISQVISIYQTEFFFL